MMDSLAEQVSWPVITTTRVRSSVGSGWPAVVENPCVVLWKSVGVIGCPVTGLVVGTGC